MAPPPPPSAEPGSTPRSISATSGSRPPLIDKMRRANPQSRQWEGHLLHVPPLTEQRTLSPFWTAAVSPAPSLGSPPPDMTWYLPTWGNVAEYQHK